MLENKVVKVSNPQILQFFHPNAVLRSELTLLDRDRFVIYTGESHNQIKKWLSDRTSTFISTVGPAEIDLTDKETLLKTVAESRGGKVPARVLEVSKDLDLYDIECISKIYWISGKWLGESEKCDVNFYNLFMSSVESKTKTLEVYFKLREVYPYTVIRSSFLTFLVKSYTLKGIGSAQYMALCERANRRFKPENIRKAVIKLGGSDNELSFIQMLMELQ